MKKTAILLANGFEEVEALTPADYLKRAGADVKLLATGTSNTVVEGAHGIRVVADGTLEDFAASGGSGALDVVIVPGGLPGAVNVSECPAALKLLEEMFDKGRLVAAICAAPALVLSKTRILEGRRWTCYPGMHEGLPESLRKNYEERPFVTDGNVVTGRGPGAAEQFAMELVRILFGEETKKKVMEGAVQRGA